MMSLTLFQSHHLDLEYFVHIFCRLISLYLIPFIFLFAISASNKSANETIDCNYFEVDDIEWVQGM